MLWGQSVIMFAEELSSGGSIVGSHESPTRRIECNGDPKRASLLTRSDVDLLFWLEFAASEGLK